MDRLKSLKLFQRMFFLLLMGFSLSVVCIACGDDDDDAPSLNTTDVAVTGFVTSLGHNYATINGYVNLNLLVGSGTPEFGVEISLSGSGASVRQETTGELVGRSFTVTIRSLSASTVYRYRSFVKYGGVTYYGEYKTFTTEEFRLDASVAVDLGLSVKWAAYNVGAESPEEYGDYFAWGETTTKSDYDWDTYKLCKGSYDSMTKYCTSSSYGTVDNKTVLDPSDDVAHVKWGGSWRMPTMDEINELRDNCTWEWTTYNEVNGMLVTGSNGNSLFLPAAGGRYGTDFSGRGSVGYYWSATLGEDGSDYACYLYFNDGGLNWYNGRYCGQSVRPVTE